MTAGRIVQMCVVGIVVTTGLIACTGRAGGAAASESASALGETSRADTTVSIDDRMLASVKVDPVDSREIAQTLAVAGKIQFDEDRLARVLAPLAGQVVGLSAKVGDRVRKGQNLGAISSREAAAAVGERIESHRDLELAEKTASMTEDLFAHEAASKMALQQAENDLAKARSRVAKNDETLRLLGLGQVDLDNFNGRVPIVSPLSGTVIERRMTDGQFVQPDGTPLLTIGDVSRVWVVGDLFERDLHLVSLGQPAAITTAAYPGERFAGRVDYISDTIDPASRSAKVRVTVANDKNRLKPEMFASIELAVSGHDRALVVPSRAVFTEDGQPFVYVEVSRGRFAKRPVTLGQEAGDARFVTSGLRAGDRIVVDGVLLLRGEQDKKAG